MLVYLSLRSIAAHADGSPTRKRPGNSNISPPEEEKALVAYLLLMSNLGYPVRIKYITSLALTLVRQRSPTAKPPGKNWPRAFKKRHPELKARTVKVID